VTFAFDLTDLDSFSQGFPHALFTRLRREAPVWFHEPTRHTPDGEGFWVLSRHRDIVAAAADAETFSSETGGPRRGGGTILEDLPAGLAPGVLLNMTDDPRHRRVRRLVTPTVSPRALLAMESELRARTTAILEEAAARGGCDFLVDVAAELPLQAIARLLGVPQEDRHLLIAWADATLDYDDRDLGQQSEKAKAAAAEMFAYGTALLEKKRQCPADDLLSIVANGTIACDRARDRADDRAHEDDSVARRAPLTELEQQMFFNLLIAAGSETTRNSIAVGLAALIEHGDQWDLLQRDRGCLATAIEEMLRWASSTTYNRRTATRDATVGGVEIRAGDKVTLWWASANRDEDVFDEPFRFDVRRDPNPHLAFGYGSHFCLGANLARLEMRLIFEGILDRFDRPRLTGPIVWTRSNKHTGVRSMPIELSARRI